MQRQQPPRRLAAGHSLNSSETRSEVARARRSFSLRAFSAACVALLASVAHAELVPASRLGNWTPGVAVGVPGGIDQYIAGRTRLIDVTQAPYNADKSGTTNAQPAIQAAVNAAGNGDVVYIPAGTYRVNNAISVGAKKGITIRGAGPNSTVLVAYNTWGALIDIGSGSDYLWNNPKIAITGSPTKGATVLQVSSTSALSSYANGGIGQLVDISLANDEALPVIAVTGYQRVRRMKSRIVAKTASTITISPGLHFDMPEKLAPEIAVANFQAELVGVEDLRIDARNGSAPSPLLNFNQAVACWAKNVAIEKTTNYLIGLGDSLHCEIRQCDLRERQTIGTNGAGILMGSTSASLIEDNIIYKIFPHMEINGGCSGNVIAYNFCEGNDVYGVMGVSIDSNHAPHNSYNLFEGNIGSKFQSDGYFGGESEATLFRNWFHATSDTTDHFGIAINLNRFSRNFNVVGNILGRPGYTYVYDNKNDGIGYIDRFIYAFGLPNIGNGGYKGYAPEWTDGWRTGAGTLTQSGTTVTASTDSFTPADVEKWIHVNDGSGVGRAGMSNRIIAYVSPREVTVQGPATHNAVPYTIWPGPNGFQGIDTQVVATTIRKGNYDYATKGIPTAEALNGETLPASLYRTSKPAFFGDLPWPAFDPSSPNTKYDAIPAGKRYLNPGSSPGTTLPPPLAQKPINVRVE